MKELVLKIKFDDEGCYKGYGDNTAELIENGIIQYLEIELESDGVIKEGWSVEVVSTTYN
jgi:hypothetical protein